MTVAHTVRTNTIGKIEEEKKTVSLITQLNVAHSFIMKVTLLFKTIRFFFFIFCCLFSPFYKLNRNVA